LVKPIRLIVIVGPTACGKTALSCQVASEFKAEIISADSRQIYRGMDIGTAKPSLREQEAIPHHFIDVLSPDQRYSAGLFAQEAKELILSLSSKSIPIILTGGTNLYIRSLINGITSVPEISIKVRTQVEKLLQDQGLKESYRQLIELEPQYKIKIHPNDIARTTRALEVYYETGRSLFDFRQEQDSAKSAYETLFIGIQRDRAEIYKRINQRVHNMIEKGLVREVEDLLDMGYSPDLPPLRTIGYKESIEYIKGMSTFNDMIFNIQRKSRIYAKKQITWNQNDSRIEWFHPNEKNDEVIARIHSFFNRP